MRSIVAAFWGEQRLSGCLSAPGSRTFFAQIIPGHPGNSSIARRPPKTAPRGPCHPHKEQCHPRLHPGPHTYPDSAPQSLGHRASLANLLQGGMPCFWRHNSTTKDSPRPPASFKDEVFEAVGNRAEAQRDPFVVHDPASREIGILEHPHTGPGERSARDGQQIRLQEHQPRVARPSCALVPRQRQYLWLLLALPFDGLRKLRIRDGGCLQRKCQAIAWP